MSESQVIEKSEETVRGGVCPTCHRTDGYINHGAHHYGVCNDHKVIWYIGYNLFSEWQTDPDGTDERFEEIVRDFELVDSFSG